MHVPDTATRSFSALRLFLTGIAMGIADLIPGVSGGTMAFILGIYEHLLSAIKSFNVQVLRLLDQGALAPGRYADITVLGESLLEVEPERIAHVPVVITIAGGTVVYEQ